MNLNLAHINKTHGMNSLVTIEEQSYVIIMNYEVLLKMETLDQNARRLFIGTFYKNNKEMRKREAAEIFIKDKVPKSTVYRIFRRVDNNESLELKSGRGRKLKLPKKRSRNLSRKMLRQSAKVIENLGEN
jgi:hypothetical protein